MRKEQIDDKFFWEIRDFFQNGATHEDLAYLLLVVYTTGYDDGRKDND